MFDTFRDRDDLAIIGTGIIGAFAARSLAEKGARVCVYERGEVTSGSSGCPVAILQPITGMRASVKREHLEGYALTSALIDRDLAGRTDAQRVCGVLRCAPDEKHAKLWERRVGVAPENVARWADVEQVRKLAPQLSDKVEGGIWIPEARALNPRAWIRVLLDHPNIAVRTHASVEAIGEEADRAWVSGPWGKEVHDAVMVCGGAQSVELLPHLRDLWTPMKGELIFLDGRGLDLPSISIGHRGHILKLADGRVMVAATYQPPPFGTGCTTEAASKLRARAAQVLPQLADAPIVQAWSGVRPVIRKRRLCYGEQGQSNQIAWLTGHASRGLLAGPLSVQTLLTEGRAFEESVHMQVKVD